MRGLKLKVNHAGKVIPCLFFLLFFPPSFVNISVVSHSSPCAVSLVTKRKHMSAYAGGRGGGGGSGIPVHHETFV